MKESRSYQICNKVLTQRSIIELSRLILSQANQIQENYTKLNFVLKFADGTSYESDVPLIFETNQKLQFKRPYKISMKYYGTQNEISLDFHHGDCLECNSLLVSGENNPWVNDTFNRIKELIDSCKSQNNFLINHPYIIYNLIALGIGSAFVLIISILLKGFHFTFHITPDNKTLLSIGNFFNDNIALYWIFIWFSRWLIGSFYAKDVTKWLFSLWPRIELDLGPEHVKKEKIVRQRIAAVFSLAIIPILISLIYDNFKYFK